MKNTKALNRQLFKVIKANSVAGVMSVIEDGADSSWKNPEILMEEPLPIRAMNAMEYAIAKNMPIEALNAIYLGNPASLSPECLWLSANLKSTTLFEWVVGKTPQPFSEELSSALIKRLVNSRDHQKLEKVLPVMTVTDETLFSLTEIVEKTKYVPLQQLWEDTFEDRLVKPVEPEPDSPSV